MSRQNTAPDIAKVTDASKFRASDKGAHSMNRKGAVDRCKPPRAILERQIAARRFSFRPAERLNAKLWDGPAKLAGHATRSRRAVVLKQTTKMKGR